MAMVIGIFSFLLLNILKYPRSSEYLTGSLWHTACEQMGPLTSNRNENWAKNAVETRQCFNFIFLPRRHTLKTRFAFNSLFLLRSPRDTCHLCLVHPNYYQSVLWVMLSLLSFESLPHAKHKTIHPAASTTFTRVALVTLSHLRVTTMSLYRSIQLCTISLFHPPPITIHQTPLSPEREDWLICVN